MLATACRPTTPKSSAARWCGDDLPPFAAHAGEDIEQSAGTDKIDALQAHAIDQHRVVRLGVSAQVGEADALVFAFEHIGLGPSVVPLRNHRLGDFGGGNPGRLPGRRRNLEGHRIVDRQVFERLALASLLKELQLKQPAFLIFGPPGHDAAGQQRAQRIPAQQLDAASALAQAL